MTAGAITRPGRTRARRSDATRARRARPLLRPLVVFTLAVVLAFFAMIYSRISLDRTAFELHQIEREIATAERTHWDLRLELARLNDPVRINDRAFELGLVFPDERITIEAPGVAAELDRRSTRWTASSSLQLRD